MDDKNWENHIDTMFDAMIDFTIPQDEVENIIYKEIVRIEEENNGKD